MSDLTGRLSAVLADRYLIERELGQGGMATVFLAADLKHERKVAIKVLKPDLAAVLGADRFVQEIATTAQLQHPNILPLFDSGSADGFLYYVMPYLEGETLRERRNRETQLGVEEAVRISVEIADALDYAHGRGVVHRDIKPENILFHAGRPMVADFGIALAVSAAAGARLTETGHSLGTPHYMSPEQATAAKNLSSRSDIYSLGAVLFEMLAGDPPHTGATAQQIIMKIVTEPAPSIRTLRATVPANVAAALDKALAKLPADRFATAKAFGEALANPGFSLHTVRQTPAVARRSRVGAVAVAFALLAAAALWGWLRPVGGGPKDLSRLAYSLLDGERMVVTEGVSIALSADGELLAYVGPGKGDEESQLWIRDREHLQARPLAGTNDALQPFFSPDGAELAFVTSGRQLRVVSLAGDAPRTLVANGVLPYGGAWGSDGFVYYASSDGLRRVRATGGGVPETVVQVDPDSADVFTYGWPDLLPDGGIVLTISHFNSHFPAVVAAARVGETPHVLVPAALARYTATGHLLWVQEDGAMLVDRFDTRRLELEGREVLLSDRAPGGRGPDVALSRRCAAGLPAGQPERAARSRHHSAGTRQHGNAPGCIHVRRSGARDFAGRTVARLRVGTCGSMECLRA